MKGFYYCTYNVNKKYGEVWCLKKKKSREDNNIQVTRFGTRLKVQVPKPFLYELFYCSGTRGEGPFPPCSPIHVQYFIPAAVMT